MTSLDEPVHAAVTARPEGLQTKCQSHSWHLSLSLGRAVPGPGQRERGVSHDRQSRSEASAQVGGDVQASGDSR